MRADHPDDQILNSLYAKEHPVRHRTVVSSNQRSRTNHCPPLWPIFPPTHSKRLATLVAQLVTIRLSLVVR